MTTQHRRGQHGIASGPVGLALRASSVENQRLRAIIERLRAESMTDCLTGLANRRALDRRLAELWSASVRHEQELACIALDIDGLKRVNDTLGHAAGDELIRVAAETIKACVRTSDFVARTGGDEFVVLLPMTGVSGARLLADRIAEQFGVNTQHLREQLDEQDRNSPRPEIRVVVGRGRSGAPVGSHDLNGRSGKVGISAGVAARMEGGWSSGQTMLDAADAGLYQAKRLRVNTGSGSAGGDRAKLAA